MQTDIYISCMYVKLYTQKSVYRMTLRGIMENGDYISGY